MDFCTLLNSTHLTLRPKPYSAYPYQLPLEKAILLTAEILFNTVFKRFKLLSRVVTFVFVAFFYQE